MKRKNVRIGVLTLLSGKMGAGKSTRARQLAEERNAVLISEDHWLSTFYPNDIVSFDDYIYYSSLLKPLIKAHVVNILKAGADVVMDFPANTVKQRKWFKEVINESGADHELIYLKVGNDVCLKRLAKRRIDNPERAKFDTESVFNEVTKYFEEPVLDEGFDIRLESE